MTSKWQFLLSRFNRQLWVRAALYGLTGVLTALIAALLGPYLPLENIAWLGAGAVKDLLTIMASSMLAVTTFSLSTMVSAFSAVSSTTTPRASTLLIEDKSAQRALSTFIGAFLFSIVGLIALSTGIYGISGRVVMFGVTIAMIGLVVVTLLNWIDQLARFGRVGETIDRVEKVARKGLMDRARSPRMGGAAQVAVPEGARPLLVPRIGYVCHIDVARLNALAEAQDLHVHIDMLPGTFVHPRRPLAYIAGECDEQACAALVSAFTISGSRTFEQDPRFGLIVLSEITSRALSPAINDPGTAIDVIGTVARLLHGYAGCAPDEQDVLYPRVHVPELSADDLCDDVFRPIARDGAAMVEVGLTLQRELGALRQAAGGRFAKPAVRHACEALQRAEAVLAHEVDIALLRSAHEAVLQD
jgi:uncharacterized membrane protein